MNHILLNPNASSKQASKKWDRVANHFSDHQVTLIGEQTKLIPHLQEGDKLVCAGGDGTAHYFINEFIETRGIDNLKQIRFGFLGIGSNNSFLQPEKTSRRIGPFYGRYGNETHLRDLVEITIKEGRTFSKRYMVSNCSIGFLALANDNYNRDRNIQKIKKTSLKLAELYTFLKTLRSFKPLDLALFSDFINYDGGISNINIMKSAYYTKDLFYPREIPPDSGNFQGLLLEQVNAASLFGRFLKAFLFGQMTSTFSTAWRGSSLKVVSSKLIPIEVDGEVYWGDSFEFKCLPQKMRVCE